MDKQKQQQKTPAKPSKIGDARAALTDTELDRVAAGAIKSGIEGESTKKDHKDTL